MDDLIHVKNASFGRYEELLLERERLRKECSLLQSRYTDIFRDAIDQLFATQLECIQKKHLIDYCRSSLDRGEPVRLESLEAYMNSQAEQFRKELDGMAREYERSGPAGEPSEAQMLTIRTLYRRLAKLLHPDVNPQVSESVELQELWQRIRVSYESHDLEDLQELEVIVMHTLGRAEDLEIPDLDEKISALEQEIRHIQETEPYLYKRILADPCALREKHAKYALQQKEWNAYSALQDEAIADLIRHGLTFLKDISP